MMKFSKEKYLSVLFSALLLCLMRSPALYSVMIDDYASTASVTTGKDGDATVGILPVVGTAGMAIQINYGFGTGSWVLLEKDYSYQDFVSEGGNSIRFRIAAVGNSNTFEMKFTDSDVSTDQWKSDQLRFTFPTIPDGTWRTLTIPLSSGTVNAYGTSQFDLSKVSRMLFGVNQENSTRGLGVVYLDKVELYKSTLTLIDDFNDMSEPNFLGGDNKTTFKSDGASANADYIPLGTEKVLEFNYNVPNADNFAMVAMDLKNKADSKNRNVLGYTHLTFRIRGSQGNEVLKAKFESPPSAQSEVYIGTYIAGGKVTTDFQNVFIPLSAFAGINFSTVSKFDIVALNSIGSGSGKVWIDDLGFARPGENAGVVRVLDEMDMDLSLSNWDSANQVDAAFGVSTLADDTAPDATGGNRVYALSYNFTPTPYLPNEAPWVVIERPFEISVYPYSKMRFQYFGTGPANNIEFKLTDDDNTVWYKKLLAASETASAWRAATIPLEQLTLFNDVGAGDSTLNLKKIKKVSFALSRGAGGNGTFAVDSLEALNAGDIEQSYPGRLISSFKVVNNPFSPNGDKVKDEVYFIYTLEAESRVNLRIYTLEGDEIKTAALETQSSGSQGLSWDGTNNGNERVRNGMYLYRLEAEGTDGRTDAIKQIVGVLR